MKYTEFAGCAVLFLAVLAVLPTANASQFKMPEELSRVESPRDMNLLQVEPTVLNERYFTSGRCERHQFVGNVLPVGAPIPDCDQPVKAVRPSAIGGSGTSGAGAPSLQQTASPAASVAPNVVPTKK